MMEHGGLLDPIKVVCLNAQEDQVQHDDTHHSMDKKSLVCLAEQWRPVILQEFPNGSHCQES